MAGFELITLAPAPFAFVARTCAMEAVGQTVSESFAALSAAFAAAKAQPAGAPLAHFRPAQGDRINVELGFPISAEAGEALKAAGLEISVTLAGPAMRGLHVGGYEKLRETYDALIAHIRDQGLIPAADMWERYAGEGEALTVEVIWPVRQQAA